MILHPQHITRRTFLIGSGALAAAATLIPEQLVAEDRTPITRAIPSSGETLPILGMGTWQTFDVGQDAAVRAQLREVMQMFFASGGRLIDSSPMYGRAEAVVGDLLQAIGKRDAVFAASKVWTDGRQNGIDQMRQSLRRMRVEEMDLMQIHNLRDWRTHLPVLRQWQQEGRIRYIGITTSHGRLHQEIAEIMAGSRSISSSSPTTSKIVRWKRACWPWPKTGASPRSSTGRFRGLNCSPGSRGKRCRNGVLR